MTKSIQTVGVCGAGGTMGAGIASGGGARRIQNDLLRRLEAALDRAAKQSAGLSRQVRRAGKSSTGGKRDAIVATMSRTTEIGELKVATW